MSYQVGDTVGPYTIVGVIGSGGMGKVFKVEHSITRRVEAMKVLLRKEGAGPETAQRFLHEIQVQAKLNHPNIAAVHNAFAEGDDLVLIMEFVEGESLDRLLDRGPIRLETALSYTRQALDALAYAHSQGVTHRDIKPANMIVTAEGILKLTDFGLAKLRGEDLRLTKSGAMVGSLYYAPPEQVKGLATVDARSDIYSLGVVLYEMVTGRPPFEGESAFELMRGHVELPPAPPIKKNPGIPSQVNDAILRALAKSPEERFQSAEGFGKALGGASAGQPRFPWVFFVAALAIVVLLLRPSGVQKRVPPAPVQSSTVAETRPARAYTLPHGAVLKVKTTLALSSDTHRAGQTFTAVLAEPLVTGDWAVAPKGSKIEGRIEESERGGRLKGHARLAVRLTRLQIADGRTLDIFSDRVTVQGGAGRILLLRRGGAAVLPASAELSFRLLRAVSISRERE